MKRKLTIVKISDKNYKPSKEDIEKWQSIFKEAINDKNYECHIKQGVKDNEISLEEINIPDDEKIITLVKVGDENYSPSKEDLETWRNVFEEAQKDPDFKIFTHPAINIEIFKIGDIIKVE